MSEKETYREMHGRIKDNQLPIAPVARDIFYLRRILDVCSLPLCVWWVF